MAMMVSVEELLEWGERHIRAATPTARLDAEVMLCHVLDMERACLRAWPERLVETASGESYRGLVDRRAKGEPVAYLTGRREFWSLALEVTPDTLIPRPETETLVEQVLALLPAERALRVVDLGTGSGAIALAIAKERPAWQVWATDCSAAALQVASRNAARLGLNRLVLRQGEWCEALGSACFDAIVSNPPYVPAGHLDANPVALAFEPRFALSPGSDGLEAIRTIAVQACAHLVPGGWLLLEHGFDQAEQVQAALSALGYVEIAAHHDTAGRPRVIAGRRAASATLPQATDR